jgi:cell division protein FtsL
MAQALRKQKYDFDRFNMDIVESKRVPKIRRRKESPEKRGNLTISLIVAVLAVSLLSMPITSEAQFTELGQQISAEQERLTELRSENVRMKTEVESKSAIKSVQTYAEDVLGMRKLDKSQIEYVDTESGSQVEIPEHETGFFTKLYNHFQEFIEYIGG